MKKETFILLRSAKDAALSVGKFTTIVALSSFLAAISIAGVEDFMAGRIKR